LVIDNGRLLVAAAVSAIGAAALFWSVDARAEQQEPQSQQPLVFRAGVDVVRVDVIVTDRNGKPILGLKPEDFEISEAGKLQKIETFKVISLGTVDWTRPRFA
jgi:hypothetical protein